MVEKTLKTNQIMKTIFSLFLYLILTLTGQAKNYKSVNAITHGTLSTLLSGFEATTVTDLLLKEKIILMIPIAFGRIANQPFVSEVELIGISAQVR